jgi:hypothetical protein
VLGNEQGIQVAFTCHGAPPPSGDTPPQFADIISCSLKRSPSGAMSLEIIGPSFVENSTVFINGVEAKKLKFKDPIGAGRFARIVAKGKLCQNLPGPIVVTRPDGRALTPFACSQQCQ